MNAPPKKNRDFITRQDFYSRFFRCHKDHKKGFLEQKLNLFENLGTFTVLAQLLLSKEQNIGEPS